MAAMRSPVMPRSARRAGAAGAVEDLASLELEVKHRRRLLEAEDALDPGGGGREAAPPRTRRPTSCSDSGRPSRAIPLGSAMAGMPAWLHGAQK